MNIFITKFSLKKMHMKMVFTKCLKPEYLGITGSIQWLLMPWLLASPVHQQKRYLLKIGWTDHCFSWGRISTTCAISPGGGTPSLRVSRYSLRCIWTIFLPPKIWPCLPFYPDLVGSHFEVPHFQHVDDLFAPKIDQIYHFIQILLGPILKFEWWHMVTEIWVHIGSGNGLFLTTPSHYLNQCWLIISEVQWH